MASYSPGVPDNIKDAILAVYDRQEEGTKHAWQICSVIPEGLEINRFAKIKSSWDEGMDHCFALKIIVVKNDRVIFKHELYRRTIEGSLSPFKRIALNKKILELFLDSFEEEGEIERIVQYAKNANENKLVVKYAPLAAKRAACVGAHMEASKLFLTAIEYAEGNDEDQLMQFYEAYAYECYLTNQVKEAIIYTGKSFKYLAERRLILKRQETAFVSFPAYGGLMATGRMRKNLACRQLKLLNSQPPSKAKAMAFSNMSQLKVFFEEYPNALNGETRQLRLRREIKDEEILSHALNNVGALHMEISVVN